MSTFLYERLNAHLAVNVSGAFVASGGEFLRDSRERAVTGLPLTGCFRQNQHNNESQTSLHYESNN